MWWVFWNTCITVLETLQKLKSCTLNLHCFINQFHVIVSSQIVQIVWSILRNITCGQVKIRPARILNSLGCSSSGCLWYSAVILMKCGSYPTDQILSKWTEIIQRWPAGGDNDVQVHFVCILVIGFKQLICWVGILISWKNFAIVLTVQKVFLQGLFSEFISCFIFRLWPMFTRERTAFTTKWVTGRSKVMAHTPCTKNEIWISPSSKFSHRGKTKNTNFTCDHIMN